MNESNETSARLAALELRVVLLTWALLAVGGIGIGASCLLLHSLRSEISSQAELRTDLERCQGMVNSLCTHPWPVLRVERLEVVDAKGKRFGVIQTVEEGVSVTLGGDRAQLHVVTDEKDGSASLWLTSKDGANRSGAVFLSADPRSGVVAISGEKETSRIEMIADQKGSSMSVRDASNRERVSVYAGESKAGVVRGGLLTFDVDGKPSWTSPNER